MKAAQRRSGRLVPDLDLLIAATAQAHGLILATLDVAHFRLIENFHYEDWH